MRALVLCVLGLLLPQLAGAAEVENELVLRQETVAIDGIPQDVMTVNGQIPGPTLRWTRGDRVRVRVRNEMTVPSSVHWHGILLPNAQDGVPGLTTPPIAAGATHVFEFPLRQAGTYWYHSHTALQEQRGLYGAIVIEDPEAAPERDVVWVLSDWTRRNPKRVYRLLRRGSDQLQIEKRRVPHLWGALREGAWGTLLARSVQRMPPMDVSDVAYEAFLSNGVREARWRGEPGERVRVRVVNAAASTYFYLDGGAGPLRVMEADGLPVEAFEVSRLLVGVAETYDLSVAIPRSGSLELRATAQDGSGSTSLWLGDGAKHAASSPPPPSRYVPMGHEGHGMAPSHRQAHPLSSHGADPDHSHPPAHPHSMEPAETPPSPRPLPPYGRLRSPAPTDFPETAPRRDILLRLTGDMERYVWSFNGKVLSEVDVIRVRRGEVLRVALENTTMMHHPMHLHGHFFRVLNGAGARAPLKHTVDVAPLSTTVIEFLGSEEGDWFFHCHILYHMKAGMARVLQTPPVDGGPRAPSFRYRDTWIGFADAAFLSHYTEGVLRVESSRHSLLAEWEIGWRNTDGIDQEVTPLYRFHVNRLYRLLAGASLEEHRDAGVLGAEALLPFNLDARAWVDTEGEGRFALEKTLSLTSRLRLFGEVEYDTRARWEGSAGLALRAGEGVDGVFRWHSEFGLGGGVSLRF